MKFFLILVLFCSLKLHAQIDKVALLNYVNNIRATGCKCGTEKRFKTTPLVWNDTLAKAAWVHAKYMFATNDFSHYQNNDEANDMMYRINQLGYDAFTSAENIFSGNYKPLDVINAWIKSPGHCNNILEPQFKEIGIAQKGKYWVMVLASK